ncbi:hypothetical protein B0H66DRAFT_601340 [Apodospora peruviana]|uniref:DUF6590 domain-containing protein n=1 Tax=Apodospora peruviana TaxID=516989 RepID=A0AAE0M7X7_9PEZI|nr:hypothetical protein B0H66DRAFT_601340 [Apodospora peruviana]
MSLEGFSDLIESYKGTAGDHHPETGPNDEDSAFVSGLVPTLSKFEDWFVVIVFAELKPLEQWKEGLGKEFVVVEKPKRFFQVDRMFETVWFEPAAAASESEMLSNSSEWTQQCPPFCGTRPQASVRQFIVVRRRLNHSLCLGITYWNGKSRLPPRGRAIDYVVLYESGRDHEGQNLLKEPPEPEDKEEDEEGIVRDSIAIIIEANDLSISPQAWLDCGRIHTVEDGESVRKIGRVHNGALPLLEKYFRESVS